MNADSYVSTGQGFVGFNMFAYCLNNPVNYVDRGGTNAEALQWWTATMWWLCGVDTVLLVGDIVYVVGIIIFAVVSFVGMFEATTPVILYEENVEAESEDEYEDNYDIYEDNYDIYDEYGYDIDAPTNERVGRQNGDTPRDNRKQNEQMRYFARGKGKDYQQFLHREFGGQRLGFGSIRDALK